MALGTASGGWKIIKTMGHKMVKLHTIHGFAAETSSATILKLAAHFGMPVSTTHSISTANMGVGFAKNPRALRRGVIERNEREWILTRSEEQTSELKAIMRKSNAVFWMKK